MDLHDGQPFWMTRDGIPSVFPALDAPRRADVVVIGAGITGTLVATALADAGVDVVVLDRRDVAHGSTAASTSMLQYEIDELLVDLAATYGVEDAEACYAECARGIDLVEAATRRIGDPCGFRRSPSIFVATRRRDVDLLQAELAARQRAGFRADWLEPDELRSYWGLDGFGAIQSAEGASVDPYALAHRGLAALTRRGVAVFDRTTVTALTTGRRGVLVATDRGHEVRASWAVLATGYEVVDVLPGLAVSLHTSFACVSEPVPDLTRRYPDGVLFWEHADPYLYGRTTDDGRILYGGKDEEYRDPLRRRRAIPSKARGLDQAISRFLPELTLERAFAWAGTFAETPDGLAYIGGHRSTPRTLFALGFGGNGITYSALAAEYLTGVVTGHPSPYARLFRLDRPPRRPS